MQRKNTAFLLITILFISNAVLAQEKKDSSIFSGSLGITNNGFSIIPTFSLNSPAVLIQLSWRKNKFSIDPDIRLSLDAKKGSMVFWFRYHAIEKKKFKLRVGAHPAFNLQIREIISNGSTSEITQMRRFIAWELTPNYQIKKHWGVGIYYLQANGLQKDGPRTSHFVNLNTSISDLNVGGNFRLTLIPAVYYLYLDGYHGNYFTATGILSHTKFPFSFQSDINKTFSSNLPGNKDFMWNVSIRYSFKKSLLAKR
jgi:hypothetical protein